MSTNPDQERKDKPRGELPQHRAVRTGLGRRDFFGHMGNGLLGTALAGLFTDDLISGRPADAAVVTHQGLQPRLPHVEPGATSVIQLFMTGGPSQVDMFDPKPALVKHEGELPRAFLDNVESVGGAGGLLPSPFKFARHGQSGMPMSEVIPHLAECADDIALIRSMWTDSFDHLAAIFLMHSGRTRNLSPSLGSWVAYGLGSENKNLPAYVALDDPDRQILAGKSNWQAGFLPPICQGTRLRSVGSPILHLNAEKEFPDPVLELSRDLLAALAREHRDVRAGQAELNARIASYELAARMQISATQALDISQETQQTHDLYGLNDKVSASYGRRCLMARRLIERGVRIVQVYMNCDPSDNPWDHHGNIKDALPHSCRQTDKSVAGLLKDLKQRGLLDRTLVVWGGEFGRLPLSQGKGRDHGANGFSVWLAGGGVQGGTIYGATDEFGYHAVENRVSVHDLHATILHCLGIDHENLVYNHHGLEEQLTGVDPARVVKEILS